jgi:hypothetical protein
MVAYGREKYGDEFWKNVTHDAAGFKGLFYPLQKGIKSATGKSYTQFRQEAFDFFSRKLLKDSISVNKPLHHQLRVNISLPMKNIHIGWKMGRWCICAAVTIRCRNL